MDAKRTNDPDRFLLSISLSEARDINELVDTFHFWEAISSHENKEPMRFMLAFARDCSNAIEGFPTQNFSVDAGQVLMSRVQVHALALFIKAYVESEEGLSWMRRTLLKMTWKTLHDRITT